VTGVSRLAAALSVLAAAGCECLATPQSSRSRRPFLVVPSPARIALDIVSPAA
jgi:hypothetical protein